jgi:hypothetical protein
VSADAVAQVCESREGVEFGGSRLQEVVDPGVGGEGFEVWGGDYVFEAWGEGTVDESGAYCADSC